MKEIEVEAFGPDWHPKRLTISNDEHYGEDEKEYKEEPNRTAYGFGFGVA